VSGLVVFLSAATCVLPSHLVRRYVQYQIVTNHKEHVWSDVDARNTLHSRVAHSPTCAGHFALAKTVTIVRSAWNRISWSTVFSWEAASTQQRCLEASSARWVLHSELRVQAPQRAYAFFFVLDLLIEVLKTVTNSHPVFIGCLITYCCANLPLWYRCLAGARL
jgi:hypothetical protein